MKIPVFDDIKNCKHCNVLIAKKFYDLEFLEERLKELNKNPSINWNPNSVEVCRPCVTAILYEMRGHIK